MSKKGFKHSEETKRKMSKIAMGRPKPKNAYSFPKGKRNPAWMTMFGKQNPNWKGGQIIVSGYVYVYSPNHPFCTKDKYVLRSRLVMEKKLGCYLTQEEVVHHINEIKDDDRIENLKLFLNNREHRKSHKKS